MSDNREIQIAGADGSFAGSMRGERDLSNIAGRYFTTLHDIDKRVETTDSDGYMGKKAEKTQLNYDARRAVPGGTTLLAVKLNFLDEVLHSVVMAAHPSDDNQASLVFMTDEFFTFFKPEEDALTIREQEIAGIQSELQEINRRISARPSDTGSPLLLTSTQKKPTTADLVRVQSKSTDIGAHMTAVVAAATEHAEKIKTELALMTATTQVLARFYSEKGQAALASISDQINFAHEVMEGVKTLSLYTGDGVEVQTICEGEEAPEDEPLTLYQNLLYLDEELAVDLLDQGFDFNQMDDLGNILSADKSLLTRMIPAQRGIVLVRIRRGDKTYFKGTTFADSLSNFQMNLENKVSYLLVRNGDNVHLVQSEVTTDLTQHLFPTRLEIEKLFQTNGRDIRPEHLDYSKAKGDFEKRTVHYKRILLMLWGLDDRLNLFGTFFDRTHYDNWFDDRMHVERLRYIYDAEDVIEEQRPTFQQWATAMNRNIQPGSRIAVAWQHFINRKSSPFCYEASGWRDQPPGRRYSPINEFGVVNVAAKDGRLVVKADVRRAYFDERRHKKQDLTALVDVAHGVTSWPVSAICLDFVTRNDLKYYLNSRKQRQNYLEYLSLFKVIDEQLRKEDEVQAKTLVDLSARLAHAGIEPDKAAAALARAVALWRASNAGALVGGLGWKPKTANMILDIAFALSGRQNDIFERVRTDITGCVPIDLRINGKGEFILYREVPIDDRPAFLSTFDEVFVFRSTLKIRKDAISEDGPPTLTYLHNPEFKPAGWDSSENVVFRHLVREETVIKDDKLSERWGEAHLPKWITALEAEKLHDMAATDASEALKNMSPEDANRSISHIVRNVSVYKNRVNTAQVALPVGLAIVHGAVQVIVLEASGLDFLAACGPDALARTKNLVKSQYKHKLEPTEKAEKIAAYYGSHLYPFTLMTCSHYGRMGPGLNFLNDSEVHGRTVAVASFGTKARKYDSIEDSIKNQVDAKDRDAVSVIFLSEGSRELAELHFNTQRDKAS